MPYSLFYKTELNRDRLNKIGEVLDVQSGVTTSRFVLSGGEIARM